MSTATATASASRAALGGLGAVRRPSFVRLTQVELRKSVDYRAGRWLLGLLVLLSVLGLTWELATLGRTSTVSYAMLLSTALTGPSLLLPVLGVLAMTGEWTQRTALTTFTLSPRRIRVMLAKILAAVLLATAVVAVIMVLAVGAVLLGALISGRPMEWNRSPADLGALLLAQVLNVLLGAGFGAVLPITGAAIAAVFVAPITMALLSETVLKEVAPWFDVFGAISRVEARRFDEMVGQSATSLTMWVLLPLMVGIWLSARREVK